MKPPEFIPIDVPTKPPHCDGRGGRREGSGRKPLPESQRLVGRAAYLTPAMIRRVERAGGGSFPVGLRKLLGKLFSRKS